MSRKGECATKPLSFYAHIHYTSVCVQEGAQLVAQMKRVSAQRTRRQFNSLTRAHAFIVSKYMRALYLTYVCMCVCVSASSWSITVTLTFVQPQQRQWQRQPEWCLDKHFWVTWMTMPTKAWKLLTAIGELSMLVGFERRTSSVTGLLLRTNGITEGPIEVTYMGQGHMRWHFNVRMHVWS